MTSTSGATKGTTLMFLMLQFLPRLLASLLGWPRFRFGSFRIVGLAIGEAESRGGEVAVGFSGCFLWKLLINFRRCMTAYEGSQVFSSPGQPFYKARQQRPGIWSFACWLYTALLIIALTLYFLLSPASNSFFGSGRALSTRPFLVVSCSSNNTWNISCIFPSQVALVCMFASLLQGRLERVQRICSRASCSSSF